MSFSYKPLLKLMIDRDIKKGELQKMINASPTTMAKISRGDYISLEVLDRICTELQVSISDVIEHIPQK